MVTTSILLSAAAATSHISIESLTRALIYMWVENDTPLNEINVWDLLQKASYY